MSEYTAELRHIVNSGFDLELDEYPIYSESYRTTLNQRILDHFWLREIGAETPARFRHFLKMTMNEIMPYYNKLYLSQALESSTAFDTDFTESMDRQQTGASTNLNAGNDETTDTEDNLAVSSDTPQALVTADDIKGNVYASKAAREDNNRTMTRQTANQSSASMNNLDNFVRRIYGNRTSNSNEMLAKLRKNFLRIDALIISELENLFMGIY